jgi:hypothetical protein
VRSHRREKHHLTERPYNDEANYAGRGGDKRQTAEPNREQ